MYVRCGSSKDEEAKVGGMWLAWASSAAGARVICTSPTTRTFIRVTVGARGAVKRGSRMMADGLRLRIRGLLGAKTKKRLKVQHTETARLCIIQRRLVFISARTPSSHHHDHLTDR